MKSKNSKSSLFLMELILSIMFFSLAAAICVQLFVKSHALSRNSVELNHAVVECESAIEYFIGCDGNVSDYETYYTKDFKITNSKDDAQYVLFCSITPADSDSELVTCHVSFQNPVRNEEIYEITTNFYPREVAIGEK